MSKIKKSFLTLTKWLADNWISIVVMLTISWSVFLYIIGFCWLFGYWANALKGLKFDLGSCWQGIGIVVGGFGSIVAMAKACWTKDDIDTKKYDIDSKYNSITGQMPKKEE